MKVVNPSVEIIFPTADTNPMKHIEWCARTCYKSEDKITDTSAERMIANLYKRGHGAMLEHYRIIAMVCLGTYLELTGLHSGFLRFTSGDRFVVSGNVRAFYELYQKTHNVVVGSIIKQFCQEKDMPGLFNNLEIDDVFIPNLAFFLNNEDLSKQEFAEHGWYTMKFVCDRGVSHEFVRHRVFSIAQESTRYCNYSKDKFGNEITCIKPCYWEISPEYAAWYSSCEYAEKKYFELLSLGAKPEEARAVLPNSLKTELIMTGNIAGNLNFDFLRCAPDAHPQARELAVQKLRLEYGKYPDAFGDLYNQYIKEN